VAAIEQLAYDNGWIVSIYLEAAEVPGMQILSILAFLILGCILAALTS
jgi:hypothetical protein